MSRNEPVAILTELVTACSSGDCCHASKVMSEMSPKELRLTLSASVGLVLNLLAGLEREAGIPAADVMRRMGEAASGMG